MSKKQFMEKLEEITKKRILELSSYKPLNKNYKDLVKNTLKLNMDLYKRSIDFPIINKKTQLN